MQLYLDIGNSRIKWALAHVNAPLGSWQAHGVCNDISDLRALILSAPWYATLPGSSPLLAIWYANVASNHVTAELEEFCSHLAGQPTLHRATVPVMQSGLRNAYIEPEELGIDRWLAALAARHIYPNTHLLIVNMGTATTIDVISAEGLFLGGCILPGLITMLTSLGHATAQLPQLNHINIATWQQQTIANNTLDAMQSGCIYAQIGAINMCREQASQVLTQTPLCLLTGGASIFIENQLMYPVQKVDHLVLQGLQLNAQITPPEK